MGLARYALTCWCYGRSEDRFSSRSFVPSKEQSQMGSRLGEHAVVIGGSVAGLLSARVLADYFQRVTILERDHVESRPAIHKSIPQGNHLHTMLMGGLQVLSEL